MHLELILAIIQMGLIKLFLKLEELKKTTKIN